MPVGLRSPSLQPLPHLTMRPSTDVFSKPQFSGENNYLPWMHEGLAISLEGNGVQNHTTVAPGRLWGPYCCLLLLIVYLGSPSGSAVFAHTGHSWVYLSPSGAPDLLSGGKQFAKNFPLPQHFYLHSQ